MRYINRQNFLNELGKLLTFMYEEDRQITLGMYNRIFDEIDDEQALIQRLMSPTRQAVLVARAYDSKSRKLQVRSESRSFTENPDETPKYIAVIEQIELEALSAQAKHRNPVPSNQLSLFEESPDEYMPDEGDYYEPHSQQSYHEPADEIIFLQEETEEAAPPDEEAAATRDLVDSFLNEFSIEGVTEAEEQSVPAFEENAAAGNYEDSAPADEAPEYIAPVRKIRKAMVPVLILYILLAIPVTIAVVALLLIPTLVSLAVAAVTISGGAVALSAAFSGFAVFADILIVVGCALVLLALGLFFLWTFVWFLFDVIVGFIRSVCHLGGKWCYREVAV